MEGGEGRGGKRKGRVRHGKGGEGSPPNWGLDPPVIRIILN